MHLDLAIAAMGAGVGFVVGLTGMGGGALMTPLLVLLFGIQPLAAVSSDLVAAVVMKPVGAGVHLKRGTVNLGLVRWLVIGSVPCAFLGVVLLKAMGNSHAIEHRVELLLGSALLLAAGTMVAKAVLSDRRKRAQAAGGSAQLAPTEVVVRPLATLAVGALGGLVVGMTSVGSGSLIIVLLLILYPAMNASQLVGTDLLQAIPLVASAALGHLLFGDVKFGLTASLLLGSLPGVYVGARLSSRAPDALIRPVLCVVLVASGLKLLGVRTSLVAVFLIVSAAVGAGLVARFWTRRVRSERALTSVA